MSVTKVTREGKKLEAPVTLFAAIESEDHEFLRTLAFRERRSLADIVREAILALPVIVLGHLQLFFDLIQGFTLLRHLPHPVQE